MPTIQQQLNQLKKDKETLNTMLNTMGVETKGDETFTQLAPLVGKIVTNPTLQNKSVEITENGTQTIQADEGYDGLNEVEVITNVASSGGGETLEKGLIVNACDENGIVTEVTIKGMSEIPDLYLGTTTGGMKTAVQPSKIIFDGTVTKIGVNSFNRLSSLKEIVSINGGNPFENIIELGNGAFINCSSMQWRSICLPNLVTLGSNNVFRGAGNLNYMWFGDKITDIGSNAFLGVSLTKLYINLPRATVETFAGYSTYSSQIICNDDEGFMTKEQFDAIDWATYIG